MLDTILEMSLFKSSVDVVDPDEPLQLPVGPGPGRLGSVGLGAPSEDSYPLFEIVREVSGECIFIL